MALLKFSQIKALKGLSSLYIGDIHTALGFEHITELHLCEYLKRTPDLLTELTAVIQLFHGNTYVMCHDCGTFDDCRDHESRPICDACIDENYFTSDRSGNLFENDVRVSVSTHYGTEAWSEDELINDGWTCADTRGNFSDDMPSYRTEGGNIICQEAYEEGDYSECSDCVTVSTELRRIWNPNGHEADVCRSCYSSNYHYCEAHDEYHHDNFQCDNEEEEEEEDNKAIRNYSTRVEDMYEWGAPIAKGKYLRRVARELWMGCELEVELTESSHLSPGHVASTLLDDVDNIICCEDGSLTNGFEIKTPPMNLHETKELFEAVLSSDAMADLRSHNGGNCGLHINLSRSGLSQLQQAKILFFFNSKRNEALLKALCRRFSTDSSRSGGGTNYSKVSGSPKLSEINRAWRRADADTSKEGKGTAHCTQKDGWNYGKVYSKVGEVNESRYAAVNFTSQKVEIRLPRGSLKRNTLLANLEMAAAVVEFTRTGEAGAGSGRYASEFLIWMANRPRVNKDFPELVRFCVDRNFLGEEVLPRTDVRGVTQQLEMTFPVPESGTEPDTSHKYRVMEQYRALIRAETDAPGVHSFVKLLADYPDLRVVDLVHARRHAETPYSDRFEGQWARLLEAETASPTTIVELNRILLEHPDLTMTDVQTVQIMAIGAIRALAA